MSRLPSKETLKKDSKDSLAAARDIRFDPNIDTLVASLSLLVLWGIYYYQSVSESTESVVVFLLIGNFALTIAFPIYYVCYARGEPLSAVGITTDGWKPAILVSSVVAVLFFPGLLAIEESTAVLIPHIITVGLMFWEPFFVHGFLQIRFEQAFGVLPGIVLAGSGFALFHVGTAGVVGVLILLALGLFHAVLFSVFSRNILVLWPILWAVGSSQGTLDSVVFGWEEAMAYAVILLVTGVVIISTHRKRR